MKQISGMAAYRVALGFTLALTCLHVVALPLVITYDGHEYLTMAQVLGTDRFATDWQPIRTPLYPALLRIGFAIGGTHPISVVAVTSGLGLIGVLTLGYAVRRVAGPVAGAITLIVLVLDPLLISYQHLALTESGVFGILALLVGLLLWQPERAATRWLKALGLGLLVAAGYYQRQNVITLAPVVALLHLAGAGVRRPANAVDGAIMAARPWSTRSAALAQAFVIVTLPHLLALPLDPYVDNAGVRRYILLQGTLRQALLPPDAPLLEPERQRYEQAVAEAEAADHLRSGLKMSAVDAIASAKVVSGWGPNPEAHFLEFVWRYPGRYLTGVGRTMLLFFGFRNARESSLHLETYVLSPDSGTGQNLVQPGPPRLDAQIRSQFTHSTQPGALQRSLWALHHLYGELVIAAMMLLVVELIAGLTLRSLPLVTLATIPLAYVGFYALILASDERYAFPAYPVAFAAAIAFPALLGDARRRRQIAGFRAAEVDPPRGKD